MAGSGERWGAPHVCDAGTVRFGFMQEWTATAEEVLAVYLDPAFWTGLDQLSATSAPEVLGVERTATSARVRLRYTLDVSLPQEAARFIDVGAVTWVEDTSWDLQEQTATVRFEPTQGGGLLRAAATASLRSRPGGSERDVRGEIRVRLPLVGGKVERAIVDGVGEHLRVEAAAVAEHLT
jgi:hypothetical protein